MVEKFIISKFNVNGVNCLSQLPRTIYNNKYDFRDNGLTPYIKKNYGGVVTDLDLSCDFGEDDDKVYFCCNCEINDKIEIRGRYQEHNIILG